MMIEMITKRILLILSVKDIMELAGESVSHDISSFKVQRHVWGSLNPGIAYVGFQRKCSWIFDFSKMRDRKEIDMLVF